MSLSYRVSWRVLIVGIVAALMVSIGAVPVAGEEAETDEAAPEEVLEVSGEAFGAEAEIEARILTGGILDLSALLTPLRAGDTTTTRALLEATLSDVAAADDGPPPTFEDELGPEPEVELPPEGGGPLSDSEDDLDILDVDTPLNIADEAEVETEGQVGANGFAESSATASGLGDDDFIEEIEAECRAELDDLEGSTRIESDTDFFPEHPDPNTVLDDIDEEVTDPSEPNLVLRLRFLQILNEQDEDDDAITVDAYREVFEIEIIDTTLGPDPVEFYRFEATVGHAHCDVVTGPAPQPVVVEPTFTG